MERIIGKCGSGHKGPLLIFVAGIHGNEPQGLIALEKHYQRIGRWST